MKTTITTTTTATIEAIRRIVNARLPYYHNFTYNGKTYFTVPHKSPDGLRYNLQIGNRFYRELTISGIAAAVAADN